MSSVKSRVPLKPNTSDERGHGSSWRIATMSRPRAGGCSHLNPPKAEMIPTADSTIHQTIEGEA